jgi:hypothetical protein
VKGDVEAAQSHVPHFARTTRENKVHCFSQMINFDVLKVKVAILHAQLFPII